MTFEVIRYFDWSFWFEMTRHNIKYDHVYIFYMNFMSVYQYNNKRKLCKPIELEKYVSNEELHFSH